jgi:glutaredoxin
MKKFLIAALIILVAYHAWQTFSNRPSRLESLYKEPYVVVYGRDSCSFTQNLLKELRDRDIKYIYENVDDEGVEDKLHPRMEKAGLDTKKYLLPVIEVNGEMFIRPKLEIVLVLYRTYIETE